MINDPSNSSDIDLSPLSWLDDKTDEMVELTRQLCDINSGTGNLEGLAQVAEVLVENFQPLSDVTSTIDLPTWSWVDDRGKLQARELGPAYRFERRGAEHRRVWLGIHYDTVYGPTHSFQKCHWLDTGRLNGPGVADAKGGIVVMLYALKALDAIGLGRDLSWEVFLNPDEEIGSPGSAEYFKTVGPRFDFGLLFEPALTDGSMALRRKGSGNFTLVVRGRAAHAGREIQAGRNAVAMMSKLLSTIDAWNGKFGESTFNVANVVGGGPANIVPDLAVARFNVRAGEPSEQLAIEDALKELVANTTCQDGYSCEVSGGITSPPKVPNEQVETLCRWVERLAPQVDRKVQWTSTGGVCDGNKVYASGLPNLDTFGPRGGFIHSGDEFLDVTSLVPKAKLTAAMMLAHAKGPNGILEN